MKANVLFLSGVFFVLVAVLSSYELKAGTLALNEATASVSDFSQEIRQLNKVDLSNHIFVQKETFRGIE
jgi:hypothetical protein